MIRQVHRLFAWLFGYFWLPCPVCGRMFGGHEVQDGRHALIDESGEHAFCVCSDACSDEAFRLNAQRGGRMWTLYKPTA